MAFETTSELALYTEKEIGHELSGAASSQRADVVAHLDRANKLIHGGGDLLNYGADGRRLRNEVVFSFARSQNPKVVTLSPAIINVAVTMNRLSNAVTFNAAPSSNVSGWFLRPNGEREVYRVSAYTAAATSATLDGSYVGSANLTAASSNIFPLQYTVGSNDILQLISPLRVYSSDAGEKHIALVDKDELVKQAPLALTGESFPEYGALINESNGNVVIQVSSYPRDLARVEVDFIPIPSTLDTISVNPTMPARYRLVLAHLAAFFMLQRNNDSRAVGHLTLAREMFNGLVEWNDKMTSSGDPNYARLVIGGFNRHSPSTIKTVKAYTVG